ncbi:hypothetical protein GGI11_004138, partial [Coemansia sp. RSA 2049]
DSSDNSNDGNSKDILMRLPFDLAVMIIRRLRTKQLYTCSLVSRGWRKLFTDPSVIYPVLVQISHFDQEPVLFRHLPHGHNGHSHHGDTENQEADNRKDEENEKIEEGSAGEHENKGSAAAEPEETAEKLRIRLEENANQQWVKSRRVLMRLFQKTLNREHRWRKGQPTTRLYLPPVPLDGTNADIMEEWQGGVKMVKMKSGIVAVLYDEGKQINLWNLNGHYQGVQSITEKYIQDNRELLREQKKYGGPELPSFTDSDVEEFLRSARSGVVRKPIRSSIKMHNKPMMFDFQTVNNVLVTASAAGQVDVYDMQTGKHLRSFAVSDSLCTIGVVHVWMDYVIVAHGSAISLWNHRTGESLADNLQTAHRAKITGAFVLDNDNHILTIDETGIIAVTDRSAERPHLDTLLNTPMYPILLVGKASAPFMMRLLHMSHLCVWGKHVFGHYELFEPGLQNLPPLDTLVVTNPDGTVRQPGAGGAAGLRANEVDDDDDDGSWTTDNGEDHPMEDEAEGTGRVGGGASETDMILEQLQKTHDDMETMYSQIIGETDEGGPQGTRQRRQALNSVPEESRYHMISIDPPFERGPAGNIVSADFRRALYLDWNFIQIADLECAKNNRATTVSFGVFPTEPLQPKFRPEEASSSSSTGNTDGAADSGKIEKRQIINPLSRTPRTHDSTPWMPQPFEAGFDPNNDQHVHIMRMLQGPDNQDIHAEDDADVAEDPYAAFLDDIFNHDDDNSIDPSSPPVEFDDSSVTLVDLETRIIRYITIVHYHVVDGPQFVRKSCTPEDVEEAREYLATFMPELLDKIDRGTEVHLLFLLAPYYIQKIFESQFSAPVLNVDHRGQIVDVRRMWREIDRVNLVTQGPYGFIQRKQGDTAYYQQGDLMPYSVHGLLQTVTAMDDSQIAVGCMNGYVVVVSFD